MNHNYIIEQYRSGKSGPEIAKELSISNSLVYKILTRYKEPTRVYPKPDLTPELKQSVQKYYSEGHSLLDVASCFNLHQAAVRRILKGQFRSVYDTISRKARLFSPKISYAQKQCILGSLLGDGSLKKSNNGRTYYYSETHGLPQKEYLQHKADLLGVKLHIYMNKTGYKPGPQCCISYRNARELDNIAELVLVNGVKLVNELWLQQIDLLGIAYWFMDDGSSSYKYVNKTATQGGFATMGFSQHENELLARWMLKFGIVVHVNKTGDNRGSGFQLRFLTDSSQKFMRLIQPYITPSMAYKIKLVK